MKNQNRGFKKTSFLHLSLVMLPVFMLSACSKSPITETDEPGRTANIMAAARFGVSPETAWQLQQAKPEILVYNRDKKGVQRLVAVEYAIPLSEPRPQGFSGDDDEWDGNTTFGLWLLHACVWEHNPNGVFTAMNPNITLH